MIPSVERTLASLPKQASGSPEPSHAQFEQLPPEYNVISGHIMKASYQVHKRLGPGLLESVYEACMEYELTKRGLKVRRQVPVPVTYDNFTFEAAYRLDMLVDDKVIIEVKVLERVLPVHKAQLLTYMKLSGHRLGLLMSFNSALMKQGVTRMVL